MLGRVKRTSPAGLGRTSAAVAGPPERCVLCESVRPFHPVRILDTEEPLFACRGCGALAWPDGQQAVHCRWCGGPVAENGSHEECARHPSPEVFTWGPWAPTAPGLSANASVALGGYP